MKTSRKFMFRSMLAVAALLFTFSSVKAADLIPAAFRPMYNPYFTTFPCYQVTSGLSQDNSQITFYVQFYTSFTTYSIAPAPTNLSVSVVTNGSGSPVYAPINAGVSQVTYPTGAPAGSYPSVYYNITGVTPNTSGSTAIYYDGRTVYAH